MPVLKFFTSFEVYGTCSVCKSRIESFMNSLDGVYSAEWNQNTQMLKAEYDFTIITVDQMHDAIVSLGYSTELLETTPDLYKKLPITCRHIAKFNEILTKEEEDL